MEGCRQHREGFASEEPKMGDLGCPGTMSLLLRQADREGNLKGTVFTSGMITLGMLCASGAGTQILVT